MSLVEENDRNLLLSAFFLLVAELAPGRVGDRAWFPERRRPFLFPLVGRLESFMGPDPLPERFGSSVILVTLMGMGFKVRHIGVHVFVIEGFEVPILEEGTLGAEKVNLTFHSQNEGAHLEHFHQPSNVTCIHQAACRTRTVILRCAAQASFQGQSFVLEKYIFHKHVVRSWWLDR